MANPSILPADTILYSPMEPQGRQFYAGEPWPGDIWSDRPGGSSKLGSETNVQALKDLIAAQEQIEARDQTIAAHAHDLAVMAKQRDTAVEKVESMKQALRDAEAAQKGAEDVAAEKTAEANRLTQAVAEAQARIAAFDGDGDGAPGGSKPKKSGGL